MRRVTGVLVTVAIGFAALPAMGPARGAESAKPLFEQRCASCHGKDGQADTPAGKSMRVKPWRTDEELKKMSDARIRAVIMEGVKEGGKQRMPAYRALKLEQLDELVKDVRRLSK